VPFVIAALLGGGLARLRGGRLSNLTNLAIRWSALPLLALVLQTYVLFGPERDESRAFSAPALLLLISYGLLIATVFANRRLPGMIWLGLGAALNILAILMNGGWMPVTARLLWTAGYIDTPSTIVPGQRVLWTKDVVRHYSEIRLAWLADRFVIPEAGVLSAVYSVGDILVMFGLFCLVYAGMMGPEPSQEDTDQTWEHTTAS
jgi:hypothetical protein